MFTQINVIVIIHLYDIELIFLVFFMRKKETLISLIAKLYGAAMQPDDWPMVLASIAHLFDGHAAFTMTVGAGAHDSPDLNIYNLPIESFVAYGEHYFQHDLWSPPWISQGLHGVGSVYSGDQLVDEKTFRRSVWFNEFLSPLDIEHSLFASLSDGSPKPAILVIDRPLGSKPFTTYDRTKLRPLADHFSKALAISRQFQILNAGIEAHEEAIASLKLGIVSINYNAKILYANTLASFWLNNEKDLGVKAGVLHAKSPESNQQLAFMLASAKQGLSHSWKMRRESPKPSLIIKSLPIGKLETGVELCDTFQNGKILLLLTEESVATDSYELFAKRYRLTRQESKVLQGIVEGLSLKEIAQKHHVSHNTVRTQIAKLLEKTYCKRQRDLIRLFLSK